MIHVHILKRFSRSAQVLKVNQYIFRSQIFQLIVWVCLFFFGLDIFMECRQNMDYQLFIKTSIIDILSIIYQTNFSNLFFNSLDFTLFNNWTCKNIELLFYLLISLLKANRYIRTFQRICNSLLVNVKMNHKFEVTIDICTVDPGTYAIIIGIYCFSLSLR